MLNKIQKIGATTALGLLLGFSAVAWIQPYTNGGTILLVFTVTLITIVFVSIGKGLTKFFYNKKPNKSE